MHTSERFSLTTRALVHGIAVTAILAGVLIGSVSQAFAATYDPLDIIPYDTWRASGSMTAADIQAFLDSKAGPLKSYSTTLYHDTSILNVSAPTEHAARKTAAQIIWDAANAFNLNPKVLLATLQKEQSLIEVSNGHNTSRLRRAMGYGITGAKDANGVQIEPYPGFGWQVWGAAYTFSRGWAISRWYPGFVMSGVGGAPGGRVVPKNASTYALYSYTPYYPQVGFWNLYVKYFGDPHTPARLMPVYRFKKKGTGDYYYTVSEGKRFELSSGKTWKFMGASYNLDTSSSANTTPLWRLQKVKTKGYYYTTSAAKKDSLLRKGKRYWRLSGTVGLVSTAPTDGALAVYRLEYKSNHANLLTSDTALVHRLTTGRKPKYRNWGVLFYVGRVPDVAPPVGPETPPTP